MNDVTKTVTQAIARVSKRDAAAIGSDSRLAEDLGIRSLHRIELAAILEDALGAKLSDADVLRAKTVGDLLALVGAAT